VVRFILALFVHARSTKGSVIDDAPRYCVIANELVLLLKTESYRCQFCDPFYDIHHPEAARAEQRTTWPDTPQQHHFWDWCYRWAGHGVYHYAIGVSDAC
jgi:hypothetical protein